MKKLKLEELEVKSLTTSLQDDAADQVKGGTTPYISASIVISLILGSSTPAY